ncbi:MAG TPA: Trx7/PDZ domain-containing (seleno)protein [Isosphaeraceae bacterium]|jgi:hypothetical protein|nr:Trx7/PDZ domain-containing (seleno)protein [Isosphaeraceae bacterium]
MRVLLLGTSLLLLACGPAQAQQDRDAKVRKDRQAYQASKDWIYDDLSEGMRVAKAAGKPLFVVVRCIPCEACQEFDDEVARRDPIIRDLLDQYVCVRIVKANALDLTHFRHDFDLSFAAYMMNPDLTIYGRYGTRSGRPEYEDISLEGLRKAMEEGLRLHRDLERIRATLAGKQVGPSRYGTPRDYPTLAGKYRATLDYEGKVASSCIHCHQIRDAERRVYRDAAASIPDDVLFPNPDPSTIGLTMDPKQMATVERVAPGSPADQAGLRPADEILALDGQPLLSTADLQWVLHHAPATGRLPARVGRRGKTLDLTLILPEGWRRGDISWRPTTWDLRRMGLGGMKLADLSAEERRRAGLADDALALRVEHVGEYGEHAVAKRAGLRADDILVGFDDLKGRLTETDLLAYTVQKRRPGDMVRVTVLRDGKRMTFRYTLQ